MKNKSSLLYEMNKLLEEVSKEEQAALFQKVQSEPFSQWLTDSYKKLHKMKVEESVLTELVCFLSKETTSCEAFMSHLVDSVTNELGMSGINSESNLAKSKLLSKLFVMFSSHRFDV